MENKKRVTRDAKFWTRVIALILAVLMFGSVFIYAILGMI